jgi:uncharacterized protein YndB with AHSA1/START domain
MKRLVAKASITIDAPAPEVWEALTKPELIKRYMFGTETVSDWKVGSQIVWKGEWQGKRYEDRGRILMIEEGRLVSYSHFSPLSGKPDLPENYHTVTVELSGGGGRTTVSLSQDNNETEEERQHSEKNWRMVLDGLKGLLEKGHA